MQNPDRVAAARAAIERHAAQAIVMDDGFQHRRLARDLDIVLVDALEPFGFDHVFPRGTLREPLAGFARAEVIVLSRADLVDAWSERRAIAERVRRSRGRCRSGSKRSHQPLRLRGPDGGEAPLDLLAGRRVAAFCGIGNPPAFAETLKRLGYDLVGLRAFADHHPYSADDLKSLSAWADRRASDAGLDGEGPGQNRAGLARRPAAVGGGDWFGDFDGRGPADGATRSARRVRALIRAMPDSAVPRCKPA